MSQENNKIDIKSLILELLDDSISPEKKKRLQDILNTDQQAQQYYAEYIQLCASLKQYGSSTVLTPLEDNKSNIDYSLWKDLASSEESAPAAEVEKAQIIETPLPKKKTDPAGKKRSIKILLAYISIAALFLLVANINNVFNGKAVAKISDSIDAQWVKVDLTAGCPIYDSDNFLKLESGVVELQYKNATVILEGPCEFASPNSSQIDMLSGSVYVKMAKGQKGFVVNTPVSKIVDLGTEFGVQIHNDKSTEVHVLEGKTSISARNNPKESHTYLAGSAGFIHKNGSDIKDITLEQYKFIKEIDSATNTISRGLRQIDLADITSGGNGSNIAVSNYWLDPTFGITEFPFASFKPDNKFQAIDSNPYIDGMFVPNGKYRQVVSSTGVAFTECPETSGSYYANLAVNPAEKLIKYGNERTGIIEFDNIRYGTEDNPCILMHANIGITYDLTAIADKYPYQRLNKFVTKAGIADLKEDYTCNADIWVVVDGQVRHSIIGLKEKGKLFDIAVELTESDRFLTLVTTDGGDPDIKQPYKRSLTCDWCVFTEPVIELQ